MTSDKYRARADQCVKAASSVADPEGKVALLNLAQRWLQLASQIDKIDAETDDTARVPLQAVNR